MAALYPESAGHRCRNHKLLNVLDQLPRRMQPEARTPLRPLPSAETQAECARLQRRVAARYGKVF